MFPLFLQASLWTTLSCKCVSVFFLWFWLLALFEMNPNADIWMYVVHNTRIHIHKQGLWETLAILNSTQISASYCTHKHTYTQCKRQSSVQSTQNDQLFAYQNIYMFFTKQERENTEDLKRHKPTNADKTNADIEWYK